MKILITIIALLFSSSSFAQTVKVLKAIDDKIAAFAKTLDSSLIVKTTKAGTFNIDTIVLASGGHALYQVSITGVTGTAIASGVKVFLVSNTNGVYAIRSSMDAPALSGITGTSWAAVIVSNRAVVRITGTTASVKWEYKRSKL